MLRYEKFASTKTGCALCGNPGQVLYQGLRDRTSEVPGRWDFSICGRCGLAWLDPPPNEADLARAYASYFTHQQPGEGRGSPGGPWNAILKRVPIYRTGVYPDTRQRKGMYLEDLRPARLLDVGCGNGNLVLRMSALGWRAEGQETDPRAAAVAEGLGVRVHRGSLEEAAFPEGSFDAATLVHVIEHVNQPVQLLAECRRILKPGGRLVVVTPNLESYLHAKFKESWHSLDPPRHLHLFSQWALRESAVRAGFESVRTLTTDANSLHVIRDSLRIRRTAGIRGRLGMAAFLAKGYQYWATLARLSDGNSGEECVLLASPGSGG